MKMQKLILFVFLIGLLVIAAACAGPVPTVDTAAVDAAEAAAAEAEAKLDAVIFDEGQIAQTRTAQFLFCIFFQLLEIELIRVTVE